MRERLVGVVVACSFSQKRVIPRPKADSKVTIGRICRKHRSKVSKLYTPVSLGVSSGSARDLLITTALAGEVQIRFHARLWDVHESGKLRFQRRIGLGFRGGFQYLGFTRSPPQLRAAAHFGSFGEFGRGQGDSGTEAGDRAIQPLSQARRGGGGDHG